jgi:hypothetical protein
VSFNSPAAVELGRDVRHPLRQLRILNAVPSAVDGLLDRELSGEGAEGLKGALLKMPEADWLGSFQLSPRSCAVLLGAEAD